MKYLSLLLLLCPFGVFAQISAGNSDEDQDQQQKAPTEIPDFNHLDEYIYQPKSNVVFGLREIGGAKISFSGNGVMPMPESVLDTTTPNILRNYHDGTVNPDTRTYTVDNGNGSTTTVDVNGADGATNSWNYTSSSQLTPDGYMQFHLYSAVTDNDAVLDEEGKSNSGMELTATHDMGRIGKHLSWTVFAGLSLNDIEASTTSYVTSTVTTTTDTYNLFGQVPPPAPYSSPGTSTQNLVFTNGTAVTDNNANQTSTSVDTTTLLGNVPLNRSVTSETDSTSVYNNWELHGAYITLRAGPALTYNFNDHFKFTVSVGPALVYAGTTYTVTEVLNPPTGPQIIDPIQDSTTKILPAYYGDATLEYDITDTAGFYFGAFDQDSGSYKQTASNVYGSYNTTVDFSNQQGVRTGDDVQVLKIRRPALSLAALTGLNLLNYLDRQILPAVLTPVKQEMHWSDSRLGSVQMAFMLGYFLTAPFFGYLGDRVPRRWLILAGILVWSAGTMLSGEAHGLAAMILYRVMVGLGEASYGTVSPAWIADLYPARRRNNAITVFYVAIPVGSALGYILGGAIAARYGWRDAFLFAGAPGVLLALALLFLGEPERGACDERETVARASSPGYAALWRNRPYLLVVTGYVAQTFAMGAFSFWAPAFLQRVHGMPLERADRFFGLSLVVTGLVATMAGGFAATAWQRRSKGGYAAVLALSAIAAAPFSFAAFCLADAAAAKAALVAAMFCLFLSVGPVNTLILETVPVALRAGAMAASIFAIHLFGDFWSAKIVGILSDHWGDLRKAILWTLPGAVVVCAALWSWLALSSRLPPAPNPAPSAPLAETGN